MTKAEADKLIKYVQQEVTFDSMGDSYKFFNFIDSMIDCTTPSANCGSDPVLEVVQRIRREMAYAADPGGGLFGYHAQLQNVLDQIEQEAKG